MKLKFILSGIFGGLFAALIAAVKLFDVSAIGPEKTSIGFSHINKAFHNLTGTNPIFYGISEILGYLAMLLALCFVIIGLIQLITRKNPFKVDKEIYFLGGLYASTFIFYALFEIIIINYRPVIMLGDEHVEASFPSSHTLLSCVIFGSTAMLLYKYIKKRCLRIGLQVTCYTCLAATVLCRLVSGVHWLTDIVGGLLLSIALLLLYWGFLDLVAPEKHSFIRSCKKYE